MNQNIISGASRWEKLELRGLKILSTDQITSTSIPALLDKASDELRTLVLARADLACETVLERFPELQTDRDSVLEIIYLEYVLRQDQETTDGGLFDEYTRRFPDYREDIVKLLQVDKAFGELGVERPQAAKLSGGLVSGDELIPDASLGDLADYQLIEVLGHGGMGVVYRARQMKLGRSVAIKTIDSRLDVDATTLAAFQNEAELASSLQHPNIAQIYEVGLHQEIPYYSMEYVSGGSLAQFLRDRPLKPELAAKLLAVIARAVDYAHSKGVVHRDLKPANVLLSPSLRPEAIEIPDSRQADATVGPKSANESVGRFEPKLVDFGLAIQLSQPTRANLQGRTAGTPSYMSPEQIDGSLGPSGTASDIYALGSILYHTLVGRPPFYAATTRETLRQVQHDEPISPRSLQPKISHDLETICLKCLRKSASARYATALELAEDLQRYLDGKPIRARPASLGRNVYKWAMRNPTLVCFMTAMVVAVALTTWLWQRSESSLAAELAERARGEQIDYDRSIALANFEYESNNVDRAMELLDRCSPEYRNWEWDFLRSLCDEPIWSCKSGNEPLVAATISPNGRYVATAHGHWGRDSEQIIYLWDVEANELLWELKGHPVSEVLSVSFSPDGRKLLSSAMVWGNSDQRGHVIEWDVESGSMLTTVAKVNSHSATYSHDGKYIFIGEANGRIGIYDSTQHNRIRELHRHTQLVLSLCQSSDGRYLASTSRNGTFAIWEIETGRAVVFKEDMGDPRKVTWSPDMSKIQISGFGGRVDTYRWRDGQLSKETRYSREHTQYCEYSPDGRFSATAAFGEGVNLVETISGRVVRRFHGHRGHARALAFDEFGRRLLTAGTDGSCRVWSIARTDGFIKRKRTSGANVSALAFQPGKSRIAFGTSLLATKPASQSGQPRIEIWDSDKLVSEKQLYGHTNWITSVGFSDDGTRLLSAALDSTVRVWEPDSGKQTAVLNGHAASIVFAAFVTNNVAISVDATGDVITWDIEKATAIDRWTTVPAMSEIKTVSTKRSLPNVTDAALSPSKSMIAIAMDGEISFWDVASHRKIQKLRFEHAINDLQFSSNSSYLAVASTSPDIYVYDVSAMKQTPAIPLFLKLKGHTEAVTSVAFSPDNKRLVASGLDETMRIFELNLGLELLRFNDGPGTNSLVAFSTNSRQIIRCEGPQVWLRSLDILDHRKGLPPLEAHIHWHRENLARANRDRNFYAASFHNRILTELEPEQPAHRINLANSLADEGKLEQAEHLLLERSFEKRYELQRLYALIRVTLLSNKIDDYREHCRQLAQLIGKSEIPGDLNNLGWYASLLPDPPIELEDKIASIVGFAAKSPEGYFHNTLALMYFRAGSDVDAINSANSSITAKKPSPPPLDWIIQSMSLCRTIQDLQSGDNLTKYVPRLSLVSVALQVKNRARNVRLQYWLDDRLKKIEQWKAGVENLYSIGESPALEQSRVYELECKILLNELDGWLAGTHTPEHHWADTLTKLWTQSQTKATTLISTLQDRMKRNK